MEIIDKEDRHSINYLRHFLSFYLNLEYSIKLHSKYYDKRCLETDFKYINAPGHK